MYGVLFTCNRTLSRQQRNQRPYDQFIPHMSNDPAATHQVPRQDTDIRKMSEIEMFQQLAHPANRNRWVSTPPRPRGRSRGICNKNSGARRYDLAFPLEGNSRISIIRETFGLCSRVTLIPS